MSQQQSRFVIGLTIFVSALGYFVDIYDLLLFGIVRVPSLRALGVTEADMLSQGVKLLNAQMAGMLLGGILWGVIGDKRGRRNVLFGSILLYSIANIANAFVTDVTTYATLRFFAGLGLAGELGAAITLVSEVMSPKNRGYGTTLVAGTGILGAVLASLIGDLFDWKVAYVVGGVMGLCLLGLRAGLLESAMFKDLSQHQEKVPRGAFLKLFTSFDTLKKYLCCICVGIPIWFVIGILITFGPEIAREFGVSGNVTGSHCIMWNYVGGTIGGLTCGLASQLLRSRRKAILIYLSSTTVLFFVYVSLRGLSTDMFYLMCTLFGISTGYWSVFVTNAAEQFGTNMRATAAITVPNFVRGGVVPMTLSFHYLRHESGMVPALLTVGIVAFTLAFASLWNLDETYGKDLNTVETF
jgi:MFS family permease